MSQQTLSMPTDRAESKSPQSAGVTLLGIVCLVATILLLSGGVRIARADSHGEGQMSVDPKLVAEVAAERTAPSAPPAAPVPSADPALPGTPGVEIAPGVIVLNTRGFNYGPPVGEVDAEAMRVEGETRKAAGR